MKYYAHTAAGENGTPLPESSGQWQPLATHLRNVAGLAKRFASPLRLPAEAELAGLLQVARAARLPRSAARRPESFAHYFYETLSRPT